VKRNVAAHGLLFALAISPALGQSPPQWETSPGATTPTTVPEVVRPSAPSPTPLDWGASPGASSPQTVRQLQILLEQARLYRGRIDGTWGPLTEHALTAYQQKNGLQTTGKLDQATLEALHVGVSMSGSMNGMNGGSMGSNVGSGTPSRNTGSR